MCLFILWFTEHHRSLFIPSHENKIQSGERTTDRDPKFRYHNVNERHITQYKHIYIPLFKGNKKAG